MSTFSPAMAASTSVRAFPHSLRFAPPSASFAELGEFRPRRSIRRRERAALRFAGTRRQSGLRALLRASAVGAPQVRAPQTAAEVVHEFYERINQRDYVGVADLFAEDCEYEDFNYADSKKGREQILKFFEKVMASFGTELKFVIDDITRDDPNAVGVIWHLDWRGKAFPFSRGCSFYRCVVNSAGERQIRFARDIVEPATKPGGVSMGVLRLVTSLFERFPQMADRL